MILTILIGGCIAFAALIVGTLWLHNRPKPDAGPQCSDYQPVRACVWGEAIEKEHHNDPT